MNLLYLLAVVYKLPSPSSPAPLCLCPPLSQRRPKNHNKLSSDCPSIAVFFSPSLDAWLSNGHNHLLFFPAARQDIMYLRAWEEGEEWPEKPIHSQRFKYGWWQIFQFLSNVSSVSCQLPTRSHGRVLGAREFVLNIQSVSGISPLHPILLLARKGSVFTFTLLTQVQIIIIIIGWIKSQWSSLSCGVVHN